MEHLFSSEQIKWRDLAREFAREEVRPIAIRQDQVSDPAHTLDWETICKGSKLGFRIGALPKEYGGLGLDLTTQVLILVELARADSAVAKAFSQCWKWSVLMATICSDEQKRRFLPEFISDDTYLLARGMTESNAGSDNRIPPPDQPKTGFRTRAERQGDVWILNGEKQFISHGPAAKLYLVDVRTDPEADIVHGASLFLIPRDTPGFSIGKVYNKAGWRFYQNAELVFSDAQVPHANLIGEVNGGLIACSRETSGTGELELGATALGACMAAMEMATETIRRAGKAGHLVSQAAEVKLAEMAILTESLHSMVITTALQWDHALRTGGKRDMAKGALSVVLGSQAFTRVTRLNMEVQGALGGEMNLQTDKLVRDGGTWPHMVGDTVNKLIAARRVVVNTPHANEVELSSPA